MSKLCHAIFSDIDHGFVQFMEIPFVIHPFCMTFKFVTEFLHPSRPII